MRVLKFINSKIRRQPTSSEVSPAEATSNPPLSRWVDPRSLQFRLGVTMATLIAMGLSCVALWTTWKVQQILIDSHKKGIEGIGAQITNDVFLYDEMMPIQKSVQKALTNRASRTLLLWVQEPDGTLVAAAPNQADIAWKHLNSPKNMAAIFNDALPPRIFRVRGRDFVACNSPLRVGDKFDGNLFIAQDITDDQRRFESVVRIQLATTISAIIVLTLSVAYYLNRTLRPLHEICRISKQISAEDLEQAQFTIHQAPTEIQQLADTFNMMLHRLSITWKKEQQSNERQRQFVSNVSHELRTPLTVVKGYIQSTLRRGENLSAVQREALDIASTEAEYTVQVLQDLLDLARADDGCIPYRMSHIILNDLVEKAAQNVHQLTNRPIHIEAETDLISAYVDETRLQQVLTNLIDNAVKYSDPPEPVIVRLSQSDESAFIEICDRGPGIVPELQDRIFERFYRVDEARTRSGGTGLGLSIVKTFVEGMNGQVSIQSDVDKGTIFTVELPLMPK